MSRLHCFRLAATAITLACIGAGCGGGAASNAPTGPPLPSDPDANAVRLSFVKLGETTTVHFAGPPSACYGPVHECVRLPSGFPPVPGTASSVDAEVAPSRYGSGGHDGVAMFFNAAVSAVGTYAPASCPGVTGACVAIDIDLGLINQTEQIFVTAIGTTVTLKVNALAADHLNCTFTGQFVRYRAGLGTDTVTILDGYVDAWK